MAKKRTKKNEKPPLTELSNAEHAELERLQDAAAKVCKPDDRRRLTKLAEIEAKVEQLNDDPAD